MMLLFISNGKEAAALLKRLIRISIKTEINGSQFSVVFLTLRLPYLRTTLGGGDEIVGQQNSCNFLALVALVARYDRVLEELIKKPDRTCKYLSSSIQNELISEASTAVKINY